FTPRQPWPAGQVITVTLASGGLPAGWPALPLRQELRWWFETVQPRLALLYPADGPADLYIYEPLAQQAVYRTRVPGGISDYDLLSGAPGGPRLYYAAPLPDGGGSRIYSLALPAAVDADSSGPASDAAKAAAAATAAAATGGPALLPAGEPLLDCPQAACKALAVSPGGRYLAYERSAFPGQGETRPQVWYLPLDPTGGQTAGSPALAGDPAHQTLLPDWSADDRLAFYDSDEAAFYLLRPADGDRLRLPNDTGQAGDWRPDSAAFLAPEISFLPSGGGQGLSGLERLADSHLLLYDGRSGLPQDLTGEPGIEDAAPAYAPDGSRLAFARKYLDVRRWTPGRQLWLTDLPAGRSRQLTADPVYSHFDFAWSLDSQRLAFVRFNQSTLSEPPEVWIIDLQSGEFTRVLVGGYAPLWLP
ncbi:MAG: TolB family protein, partial [Chloroflexota bacterium]